VTYAGTPRFCINCGHPLPKGGIPPVTKIISAVLIFGAILAVAMLDGSKHESFTPAQADAAAKTAASKKAADDAPTGHRRLNIDVPLDAYRAAQSIIRSKLKYPYSAEFPSAIWGDVHANQLDDGSYQIRTYVEAQNGLGLKLKMGWICELKEIDGSWTVTGACNTDEALGREFERKLKQGLPPDPASAYRKVHSGKYATVNRTPGVSDAEAAQGGDDSMCDFDENRPSHGIGGWKKGRDYIMLHPGTRLEILSEKQSNGMVAVRTLLVRRAGLCTPISKGNSNETQQETHSPLPKSQPPENIRGRRRSASLPRSRYGDRAVLRSDRVEAHRLRSRWNSVHRSAGTARVQGSRKATAHRAPLRPAGRHAHERQDAQRSGGAARLRVLS
jgi:hypothetical protein